LCDSFLVTTHHCLEHKVIFRYGNSNLSTSRVSILLRHITQQAVKNSDFFNITAVFTPQ